MISYSLDINDVVSVSGPITEHHFGANYVYNYERFGDQPWEKFDELIEDMGLTNIRYPGGNSIETNFDFTNPNSTTNMWGQIVTPLDEFIEFIGSRGLDATIIIPTRPFLPGESHEFVEYDGATNNWVVNPGKLADAKADIAQFVRTVMDEARANDARIYAIELGNEYPGVDWTTSSGDASKMNAKQYGAIANELAKIIQETIDDINDEYDGVDQDPQIISQIWGDYNQDGFGTDVLKAANSNVLSQFDEEGLAAIDGLTDHVYFKNLKSNSQGEQHSYETLSTMIADMLTMSDEWAHAAGRDLDTMISEWNIQKFSFYDPGFDYWDNNDSWEVSQDWIDHSTFGLKQVAPMLEMFSAFLTGGVDSAHIWSVMYSSSAMGTHMNGGQLFAGGGLMKLMQENLLGTRYIEFGIQTDDHDIHAFEGDDEGHVFVSSLSKDSQEIKLDLADFGDNIDNIKIKYLRADEANSDGEFTINGTTYILPDTGHAYLEADLSLLIEQGALVLDGEEITVTLGAFETAYVSFDREGPKTTVPSDEDSVVGTDFITDGAGFSAALHGQFDMFSIDGRRDGTAIEGSRDGDRITGTDNDDTIYGNDGNDLLIGGDGDDRLFGGSGHNDLDGDAVGLGIWGSFGVTDHDARQANDDTLKGGKGNDLLVGGAGNDRLEGGEGNDMLSGGLHGDTFVFSGAFGHDVVTDFDASEDKLAITSPEALTTKTQEELISEFARELGSDVVIDIDEDHSITLRDITIAELEEADVFVA